MTATFELEVTEQHWLGAPPEQPHDGCSHGGIRAAIAGVVVTSDDAEYGIAQSALALLRTLERGHGPSDRVNGGYLLSHGCGYPLTFGCSNFGTDCIVRHEGDQVMLSQPVHVDALGGQTEFDVEARVPMDVYRREIVRFADTARAFYLSSPPRNVDASIADFHDRFWAEYEERLAHARAEAR